MDIAGSGDSKSNVLTGTPASAKSRNGESDEIGAGVSNELGSSKTGLGHGKKQDMAYTSAEGTLE